MITCIAFGSLVIAVDAACRIYTLAVITENERISMVTGADEKRIEHDGVVDKPKAEHNPNNMIGAELYRRRCAGETVMQIAESRGTTQWSVYRALDRYAKCK